MLISSEMIHLTVCKQKNRVTNKLFENKSLYKYIYIYIYICVCVCVCVNVCLL